MLVKIIKTVLLFLMVIEISSWGQAYQKTGWGMKTTVNATAIEIQVYSPSIVRIIKVPQGKAFTKESLSVTMTPQKTDFSIQTEGAVVSVKTSKMKVKLDTKTGTIGFTSPANLPLLGEKTAGTFVDFDDAGSKTYSVNQTFLLDTEEAIYGLGQQQQGKMSQRNVKLNMVQGNTDDYIPFFVSTKGYGLFWDNYSPTIFDDKPEGTSFRSEVGDGIDYYFMAGESMDGAVNCMRELTGKAPMFPLWTFGFWQSRERYKSQDEVLEVVKKYRELGVPLDGIIQDWQYWGNNYLWNAMEFLNPGYTNPQRMIDEIHRLNGHMIISIWNSFGPMTKQYKKLDKIGALYNIETWPQSGSEIWPPNPDYPSGVRVYDAYNPAAREIYWDHLSKGLFSLGIDGWWMDSSEPDHFNPKPVDFDTKTYLGSFRKVRNAFPLMTVGGVSQHQRAQSSGKRVFILTRSAFAGQQRYGANTWSGDIVASWPTLKNQISAGLNFSMSGIPYWNCDIGGFFLWNFKNPLTNADYRELQVRWMEFGTFCPMMRSHGEGYPREIYQFGKKGNPTYDAIEKFINLRYSFLPYIYATSWKVTANNASMIRALSMDFTNDKQTWNINDEYMFGNSLLVSPVTEPMYWKKTVQGKDSIQVEDFSTVKTKGVYLPKGTDWFDFWTGEKFNGGQTVKKDVPLDIIPLYIKAGTILPVGPKVQYATEKKWDNLEMRIYEGKNGEFILYEDENDNYNYEKGVYETISFSWNDAKKELTIGDRKGSFPGMLENRIFNVILVGKNKGTGADLASKPDKTVSYAGKKIVIKL